ncbi:MAG: c-type cytochrome [Azospirillum sp.]|nr:c-type cytochrome [Azospirillum sp.]
MTAKLFISGAIAVGLLATALAGPAQAADAELGQKQFKKFCASCHTVEIGKHRVGPSLHGIVGRQAGSAEGYSYSSANRDSGVVWDEKTLDLYLTNPRAMIPGTKMIFFGVKAQADRDNLIAYLKTVSGN